MCVSNGGVMRTLIAFFVLAVAVGVCSAQWIEMTNWPMHGENVVSLAINGQDFLVGTLWGNEIQWTGSTYASTTRGTTWQQVGGASTAIAMDGSACWRAHYYWDRFQTESGVHRSTDRGITWNQVSPTWSNHLNALLVQGSTILVGGGTLHLSTDGGSVWTMPMGTFFSVLSCAAIGNRLLAGTQFGVYQSTNGGASWQQTSLTSGTVTCLATALDELGQVVLFAGMGGNNEGGVFLSADSGTTWTSVSTGLPVNIPVRCFGTKGTHVFAGLDSGGVFVLRGLWENVSANLQMSSPVSCLALDDSFLYAGGWGVWRRPLHEMVTDVKASNQGPSCFALHQNYPNPFNPSTTIRYDLSHTSFITLTVYNTLGQQVAQLVNEQQQTGYHNVVFRGDGLASGVYFYRLEVGAFVESKKLVILR
jgi:hypothetical protein